MLTRRGLAIVSLGGYPRFLERLVCLLWVAEAVLSIIVAVQRRVMRSLATN